MKHFTVAGRVWRRWAASDFGAAPSCRRYWSSQPDRGSLSGAGLSMNQQQRGRYGISVTVVTTPHPAGSLGDNDGLCARDATLSGVRGTRAGSNEYPEPFGACKGSRLDIIPSWLIIMEGNRMLIW
jgi:hypothetical protein